MILRIGGVAEQEARLQG